ncbi:MAG: hypothetical protein ABRQ37_04040 [Candidatus Eremiobacterota bacterium]
MKRANWEYHILIIITGILYMAGAVYTAGLSLFALSMAGSEGSMDINEGIYELPAIFKYYLLFKINFWWVLCILIIIESLLLIAVSIQLIRLRHFGRIFMVVFNVFYILRALWNILLSVFAWKITMQDIPVEGLDPVRAFLLTNYGGLISSVICTGPWILLYIAVIILLCKKQVRQLFS